VHDPEQVLLGEAAEKSAAREPAGRAPELLFLQAERRLPQASVEPYKPDEAQSVARSCAAELQEQFLADFVPEPKLLELPEPTAPELGAPAGPLVPQLA
jgi:hypothetical protein